MDALAAQDAVFEGLINYALIRHLTDSIKWEARNAVPGSGQDKIGKHHATWAKILEGAEWRVK